MKLKCTKDVAISSLALLLILLVILAVIAMILIAPIRSVEVDEERRALYMEGLSVLELSLKCDVGRVMVDFSDEGEELVLMKVQGEVRQSLFSMGDPVQISWDAYVIDSRLRIEARVGLNAFSTSLGMNGLDVKISISPSLLADLTVEHTVGEIQLQADESCSLSHVRLIGKTGSVAANLAPGTKLLGDLSIQTTTGNARLYWDEVDVQGQVNVSVRTTTGSISISVIQTQPYSGSVLMQGSATTGRVDMEMSIQPPISSRISSSVSTGSIEIASSQGFVGGDALLSSANYPSPQRMDVFLSTNTGSIRLDLVYS
ncbi:MAG: hypothetical protein QW520_04940 [Methanomassiliicoccales archaeon]